MFSTMTPNVLESRFTALPVLLLRTIVTVSSADTYPEACRPANEIDANTLTAASAPRATPGTVTVVVAESPSAILPGFHVAVPA